MPRAVALYQPANLLHYLVFKETLRSFIRGEVIYFYLSVVYSTMLSVSQDYTGTSNEFTNNELEKGMDVIMA
jgi:hypothetical protein